MQQVEVSSFTRVLNRFYIGDRDVVMLQANFKFIIYKGKLSSGSMQYNGEYRKRVSSYFQRGKILFFPDQVPPFS